MTTLNKYMHYILSLMPMKLWKVRLKWHASTCTSSLNAPPPKKNKKNTGLMTHIHYTTTKNCWLPKPSDLNDAKMYWKGYTRHLVKEDFGEGFSQQHGVPIPAGSLNVQALEIARSTSHQIVTMSYSVILNVYLIKTDQNCLNICKYM